MLTNTTEKVRHYTYLGDVTCRCHLAMCARDILSAKKIVFSFRKNVKEYSVANCFHWESIQSSKEIFTGQIRSRGKKCVTRKETLLLLTGIETKTVLHLYVKH